MPCVIISTRKGRLLDSNVALVIVTGVLAVLTAYYAIQTKRQVDLVLKQRRKSIMPMLQIDQIQLIRSHTTHESLPVVIVELLIILRNIGGGPAIDVRGDATSIVEIIHGTSRHQETLHFSIWSPNVQDLSFANSGEQAQVSMRTTRTESIAVSTGYERISGATAIRFLFSDEDGEKHHVRKEYLLPADYYEWKIDDSLNTLYPFSDGYPRSLLKGSWHSGETYVIN